MILNNFMISSLCDELSTPLRDTHFAFPVGAHHFAEISARDQLDVVNQN